MSVYRTRSPVTQEPTRLIVRSHEVSPSVAPAPARPAPKPPSPAKHRSRQDWFLWLLWAVLVVGFAGVSFIVYAVIFGTAPVAG